MTTNVSFALLDAVVVGGRGDDPVLVSGERTWSHARLLEEVAAMGGVLRHLGVSVGVPCALDLADPVDAVVAALAVARLGGVVTTHDDAHAAASVVTAGSVIGSTGRPRLVRGVDAAVEEPDLDWVVMLRAGRTDPAGCEVLAPEASYSMTRSVGEQIAALAAVSPPHDAVDLRALLQV